MFYVPGVFGKGIQEPVPQWAETAASQLTLEILAEYTEGGQPAAHFIHYVQWGVTIAPLKNRSQEKDCLGGLPIWFTLSFYLRSVYLFNSCVYSKTAATEH